MARRRRRFSLFPKRRSGSRRRRRQDRLLVPLLLLGAGVYLLHADPAAVLALAGVAGAGAIVMWGRRRAVAARYRAALLASGARDPMQLSAVEFEKFCALLLDRHGWEVQTTKTTGDYGADILARRGRVRMVVQCKRHAAAVGVSAVQEVHAALSFYGAQRSAVMTTRGFTRAAQALAARTGTALIVPGRTDLGRALD